MNRKKSGGTTVSERKNWICKKEELDAFVKNIKQYQTLCGNLTKFQKQYVDKTQMAQARNGRIRPGISDIFRWTGRGTGETFESWRAMPGVRFQRASEEGCSYGTCAISGRAGSDCRSIWNWHGQRWKMQSKKAAELVGKVDLQKKQIMEKLHELEKEKMLAEPMESENWKVQDIQSQIHNKQVELAEQENKLTEQILDNTKKVKYYKNLQKQIQNTEKMIVEKQAEREDLSGKITALNAEIQTESRQLEEQSQNLKFEDGKLAEQELRNLQMKKVQLKQQYDEAQKNVQKCSGEARKLEGQMEQCRKQLENLGEFSIEKEQDEKRCLEEIRTEQEQCLKDIQVRLAANQKALAKIQKKSKDIIELEQKWTMVKALSNTANGNISGKEKIMLETYVQMTYFDRILERANVRFMVMSEGQYELARSIAAGNNRSQSGLELDVIDHYNGTRRSVKTLSGGESFKASLSLALGLSDEVQSRAGGIRLDTMFVDEGFGSLDDESLEQAMKALAGLSEGNKLVGIISHVGELKERIDKQIIVTKEKAGGSRAVIV